jgi:endonuclease G
VAKRVTKDELESAIAELNKKRSEWLRRPDVSAVDVGFKIKEKELTDELAIRVHVKRKKPIEALESYELFSTSGDPSRAGAFPIDVLEAEYAASQVQMSAEIMEAEAVDRRDRVRPLVGGISVGNPRISAGTLGAIVWDRTDCQVSLLSNWHVLCGSRECQVGESILQPGKFDGGRPGDEIAKLKRWRLDRDMDAALATLVENQAYSRDILEADPILGIDEPRLGMSVIKSGRTTGLTEGIVDGVSHSITINYGEGNVQTFHDQIHIVPRPPWPSVDYEVSKGGDSGSVWINQNNGKAVGLHFAGETDPSPTAENAVANRMTEVARVLNFSFTPLYCKPKPNQDQLRDAVRRILCRYYPRLCGTPQAAAPYPAPDNPQYAGYAQFAESMAPPAYQWMGADMDAVIDEIIKEMQQQS